MDLRSLVTLPRTEAEYREWVEAHPHGFIINAWRVPGDRADNAMRWHQVGCSHIDPHFATETPPFSYVSSERLKACSTNPAALAIWAKTRSEPLLYCEECLKAWEHERS